MLPAMKEHAEKAVAEHIANSAPVDQPAGQNIENGIMIDEKEEENRKKEL